ncbi:DUF3137 domain-containing protein [Mycoplasmopsis caviae]|uniref:DUF3137 domain-containing protein n=1 Tax=Mycoplasmopsis caviae TaxID=55603 RepID=A0A3P8MEK2_9BACT|nr:DUF3137 domain-containing protein [Mycoplasmopsis caviae]UUD35344.1 DUF3137 domain-containing protein [Mycoplasmopsis caviae]VDR41876.1 Uncharacterised protein [Mycoplasmopsis caviae]
MAITQKPKTYLEFVNENSNMINDTVVKSVESILKQDNNAFNRLKILLIVSTCLLVIGLVITMLGIYFVIGEIFTNTYFIFYFTGITLISSLTMFFIYYKDRRKLLKSFKEKLENDGIFQKVLNSLSYKVINPSDPEHFKLFSQFQRKFNIDSNSLDWIKFVPEVYWIPSDAGVYNIGQMFFVVDKYNNLWAFQTVKYHWTRATTDAKGNTVIVDYYENATVFEGFFNSTEKSSKFTLALGTRCGLNRGMQSNIEFENKTFNKLFKPYTTDKLKAFNVYQPYPMDVSIEHYKQYPDYTKSFGLLLKDQNVKCWLRPKGTILEIDIPKLTIDKNKITKAICKDVLNDAYLIYWLFSFLTIPAYFN